MRIAMFSDTFHPAIDGVVTGIDAVSREVIRRGHAVRFFVPKPADAEAAARASQGLDVHTLPSIGLWTYGDYRISLPFSGPIREAFGEFRPDVVHVHSPCSLGWVGLRCARRSGLPVIATYHTLLPEFLVYLPIPGFRSTALARRMTWAFTRWFYNKADVVATLSQHMADQLEWHHGKPAVALSSPIRFELFHRFVNTPRPRDVFRLVFFGRMSFEKNVEVVLDALKVLLDRGRAVELWLIGTGPAEESLKRRTAKLGVGRFVSFLGVLRDEQLAEKVASCHCLVTPSTIETQGLTIAESMAAGLPCVGADKLAIPDTLKDGQNGFLFPPFDAKAAAAAVDRLISSPELYGRLSAQAVETARPFSQSAVADRYLALLDQLRSKG